MVSAKIYKLQNGKSTQFEDQLSEIVERAKNTSEDETIAKSREDHLDFFRDNEPSDLPEKDPRKSKTEHRDVFYLMERFKEDNNGVATTDVCVLFSYWQTNFAEEKTLINYNSKSFNNKTYLPSNLANFQNSLLDVSPIERNPLLEDPPVSPIKPKIDRTSNQLSIDIQNITPIANRKRDDQELYQISFEKEILNKDVKD